MVQATPVAPHLHQPHMEGQGEALEVFRYYPTPGGFPPIQRPAERAGEASQAKTTQPGPVIDPDFLTAGRLQGFVAPLPAHRAFRRS